MSGWGKVDMAHLLEECLEWLATAVGIHHSLILMADNHRQILYTVATHGYPVALIEQGI